MKRLERAMTGAAAVVLSAAVLIALGGVGDASMAKDRTRNRTETTKTASTSRAYMGVYMQNLTQDVERGLDLKVDKGVLVSGVEDDGPADKAGLKEGDVIVKFNGDAVTSPDDLRQMVRDTDPGSKVKLQIMRDGRKKTLSLTLGERPDDFRYSFHRMMQAPEIAHAFAMIGGPKLGIQAHEIETGDMASYFDVKPGEGVLVLGVQANSVADRAGIKPGDVVTSIDKQKVSTVDDIRDACRHLDNGDEFTIGVVRHGKSEDLKATMDESGSPWAFSSDNGDWQAWRHHAPRARMMPPGSQDQMQRELDQLKKEVEQLKQKLENHDG